MAKHRPAPNLPALYALVTPGLEAFAAEEIEQYLGGEIKRSGKGFVVFRLPAIAARVLELRTTEDIFLLAWGTDQLSYRAADLESIQRWTDQEADWPALLAIHHGVRPKPKGKPTYHLVTQMTGEHGYRRIDAAKALVRGLAGKLPASWRAVEENAAVEIWLTIHGATAFCGLRLSDRSMRHRTYKQEHLPASLRPTVAAAMVRLAAARPGQVVLDPMCGAGTILAEQLAVGQRKVRVWGGDIERSAVRAATANLRPSPLPLSHQGERGRGEGAMVLRWDATRLPLPEGLVDRIISNPPFGRQLGEREEMGPLYRQLIPEYDRVLKPGGRAVLLVGDPGALASAVREVGWKRLQRLHVRVLGLDAELSLWQKAGEPA